MPFGTLPEKGNQPISGYYVCFVTLVFGNFVLTVLF